MSASSLFVTGNPSPPPAPQILRAGSWQVRFEDGDLRDLRWGGREVVRRIYLAVRDRHWGTVPRSFSSPNCTADEKSFAIRYTCEFRQDGIAFSSEVEFRGDENGVLHCGFTGIAGSTFLRNRLGFCVLLPIFECAAAAARARHSDGTLEHLVFPDRIAVEQPVRGFQDLTGLSYEVSPGAWAELEFSGDIFEMEDQRNWTDASFKLYSTPLHLPRPVEVPEGTRLAQQIQFKINSPTPPPTTPHSSASGPIRIDLRLEGGLPPAVRIPDIGLGSTRGERAWTARELERLGQLGLTHLRVEIHLERSDWASGYWVAARNAAQLGLALELVLFLPLEGIAEALQTLRRELTRTRADVSRVLVFAAHDRTTDATLIRSTREHLGDLEVPIGGGTDANLAELNLRRPPSEVDFISWSMNPQVHAFDNTSIAETPIAAAQQVASVAHYFPEHPQVVSPITLRPRSNAGALLDGLDRPDGELPPTVDVRQLTLFGAAWTAAMMVALLPSGAESLTYFETTGWRGVMEAEAPSAKDVSPKFPSVPGQVFPLWHVFVGIAGFPRISPVPHPTSSLITMAVLSNRAGRRRLLAASLCPTPLQVEFTSIGSASVRLLDSTRLEMALQQPERFWAEPGQPLTARLEFSPYAVAFIDLV